MNLKKLEMALNQLRWAKQFLLIGIFILMTQMFFHLAYPHYPGHQAVFHFCIGICIALSACGMLFYFVGNASLWKALEDLGTQ